MSIKKSFFKSTAFGGILGKALGAVREALFFIFYGVGNTTAAFKTAFFGLMYPVNVVFGDFATSVMLPKLKSLNCQQARKSFFHTVLLTVFLLSLALTLLVFGSSDQLAAILIPGSEREVMSLAATFIQFGASVIIPFALANYVSAYLAFHGIYTLYIYRPALTSCFIVIGLGLSIANTESLYIIHSLTVGSWLVFLFSIYKWREIIIGDIKPSFNKAHLISFIQSAAPLIAMPFLFQLALISERRTVSHGPDGLLGAYDYGRYAIETLMVLIIYPLSNKILLEGYSDLESYLKIKSSTLKLIPAYSVLTVLLGLGAFLIADSIPKSIYWILLSATLLLLTIPNVSILTLTVRCLNCDQSNKLALLVAVAYASTVYLFNETGRQALGYWTIPLASSLASVISCSLASILSRTPIYHRLANLSLACGCTSFIAGGIIFSLDQKWTL